MMKQVPVGIDDFKKLIDSQAYYIDKTQFIVDCMKEKVTFYTRPRRFGKTLNMSMLYYFFSNKESENAYLFDGLKVTNYPEVMKHQNQYPVVFMTLKDMVGENMEIQTDMFASLIASVVNSYSELLDSPYLYESDKKMLLKYKEKKARENDLTCALYNMTDYLQSHFKQEVIVLIDEYDAPLQVAYQNGYYKEMSHFLGHVFSCGLKTNNALEKGILTGCLQYSEESVFTGFNNFNVYSILDMGNQENFGFDSNEVKQMLEDYHISDCFDEVKKWYGGYLFGDKEIYNPWSTLKYVQNNIENHVVEPRPYWVNTSGNDMVYDYIKNGGVQLRKEFEKLVDGGSVSREIISNVTYKEMSNIYNVYSFLLFIGYLKIVGKKDDYEDILVIPNKEVSEILRMKFMAYFEDYKKSRKSDFYKALISGDEIKVNRILNSILGKRISCNDNKENFYYEFLMEMFSAYDVKSNKNLENGSFDLCVFLNENTELIVKGIYSRDASHLASDASIGAMQIVEKKYSQDILNKRIQNVIGYGISFYKKECYVIKSK